MKKISESLCKNSSLCQSCPKSFIRSRSIIPSFASLLTTPKKERESLKASSRRSLLSVRQRIFLKNLSVVWEKSLPPLRTIFWENRQNLWPSEAPVFRGGGLQNVEKCSFPYLLWQRGEHFPLKD